MKFSHLLIKYIYATNQKQQTNHTTEIWQQGNLLNTPKKQMNLKIFSKQKNNKTTENGFKIFLSFTFFLLLQKNRYKDIAKNHSYTRIQNDCKFLWRRSNCQCNVVVKMSLNFGILFVTYAQKRFIFLVIKI